LITLELEANEKTKIIDEKNKLIEDQLWNESHSPMLPEYEKHIENEQPKFS